MADRTTIIAQLAASFPQREIGVETIGVYVRALADIPVAELEPIAQAYMLEGKWFPTVRDLRRAVAEQRLRLPGPDDAWETALQWANQPTNVTCPADCNRGVVPGEGVVLDRSLIETVESPVLREQLGRIADAAAQPTALCSKCGGLGEIPNPGRIKLPEAVRRALDHVGGRAGILESETLSVIRAQFLKAYERTREESLRNESLASAGLQLDSGAHPAIEGGDRG